MKKRIEILFGPEGEVIIEAFGRKGKVCKNDTKFLEDALGKATDIKHKIEWHLENAEAVRRERARGFNPSNMCG